MKLHLLFLIVFVLRLGPWSFHTVTHRGFIVLGSSGRSTHRVVVVYGAPAPMTVTLDNNSLGWAALRGCVYVCWAQAPINIEG